MELLEKLLDAWRACRAPEVAALVERTGAATNRPAIIAATVLRRHLEWVDIASRNDPADVDRLLAALTEATTVQLRERVSLLEQRPDDPRICAAFGRMVEAGRQTASDARPIWTIVFRVLERAADPRTLDALARLSPVPGGFGLYRAGKIVHAGEVIQARPPSAPPAWIADVKIAAPSSLDEEGLLQEIAHAPDDDGPRQVLADLLTERGDPRGELIALQIARARAGGAPSKREQALERSCRRLLLGPLHEIVDPKRARFARGFLDVAPVMLHKDSDARIGHPLWSTVRELHFGQAVELELVVHASMRSLRVVHGLDTRDADALARHPTPLPFEEIGFHSVYRPISAGERAAIGAATSLPQLRRLTVTGIADNGPAGVEWLARSPLGRRLESLRLQAVPLGRLDAWRALDLRSLTLVMWNEVEVTLSGRRLEIAVHGTADLEMRIGAAFAPLPDDFFDEIVIDGKQDQARLEAFLARFTAARRSARPASTRRRPR